MRTALRSCHEPRNVMAFYLGLLVALAVAVPTALATTCVECTSQYTTAYAASSANANRCTAVKNYAKCLSKASGSGCDVESVQPLVINLSNQLSALGAGVCSITTSCFCQLNQMVAAVTTNDLKCKGAATYVSCLHSYASTQESCDASMTNNDYRWEARKLFSSTCMCSGHAIRFSLAMFLVVVAGMFLKN